MALFKLLIYFLSIIIPGYLMLRLILKRENLSLLLSFFLAYGLGSYFITIQLFIYLFIFRLKFYLPSFYLIVLLESIILLFWAKKRKYLLFKLSSPNFKLFRIKLRELIFILLILFQCIFLVSNALVRPVISYDSLAMWSFKAKTLYYERTVDFNPENYLYLGGGGHINYPWHIPLLQYWLHVNLGEYNDLLVNFIFVFYFLGSLAVIYYFLKRYIGIFQSLVFTFLLSSMPLFFYHGYNAYADLPLSFYILLSFVFLYLWLSRQNRLKYLFLSGVFLGISYWTKDTAILIILPCLATLFLYYLMGRVKIRSILLYVIFIILPVLPWIIFKFSHRLDISNVGWQIGFHPEVLKSFAGSLISSNSWNIWWFIVILSFIIFIKKIYINKNLLFSWLFLFSSLASLLAVYLFTERYLYAVDYTAIVRNIMIIVPTSVLVVAITLCSDILQKGQKNN